MAKSVIVTGLLDSRFRGHDTYGDNLSSQFFRSNGTHGDGLSNRHSRDGFRCRLRKQQRLKEDTNNGLPARDYPGGTLQES